jgi:hypothetical protein
METKMGLKDLIASKSSLAEDVIEEIVSEYVRYDTDHKAVFLTPEGHELSGKSKVLIYLVALQGWPFVVDDLVPTDPKPGEIEEHTGIPGGTLRPLLKELKDRRIIIEKSGRYSVLSAALQSIKKELGSASSASSTRSRPKKRKAGPKPNNEAEEASEIAEAGSSVKKKTARKSASTVNVAERFTSWIDQGYFDDWKTLSDVQKRFHKEAVMVPQTSMPNYLLGAVRAGRLERDKHDINGKTVWAYRKAK